MEAVKYETNSDETTVKAWFFNIWEQMNIRIGTIVWKEEWLKHVDRCFEWKKEEEGDASSTKIKSSIHMNVVTLYRGQFIYY